MKLTEGPKQLTGIITLPGQSFNTGDDLFMHVSKMIHSKTHRWQTDIHSRERGGKKELKTPKGSITKCAPKCSRSIPGYFFLNINDFDDKSALSASSVL